MDQLAKAVIKVINARVARRYLNNGAYKDVPVNCIGLSWELTHSNDVRYTHYAPEGRPTSGWGKSVSTKKYSGWYGRVWVRYTSDYTTFGSEPFNQTLTHTGSGGDGGYDGPWEKLSATHFDRYGHTKLLTNMYPRPNIYSWDYSIFDLDWPKISDHRDQIMMDMFEDKKPITIKHSFLWEDATTKMADDAFFADYARVTHNKEIVSLLR